MKVELAQRLNAATAAVDTAKSELTIACATGNDESVEAAGDKYVTVVDELNAVFDEADHAEGES